LAQF